MGLRTKFNLVLIAVAVLGMVLSGYFSRNILQKNAEEEVLQMAGLVMESAMSIRGYTIEEIRPLIRDKMDAQFIPQMVPAYAAHQNIKRLRKRYADYNYKEATLNPTNPASRATEWETEIVEYFRNHTEAKEHIGIHTATTGASLYLARPITIKKASCLTCHGEVGKAPQTLLAKYGNSNGFGWKLGETVGAQIVTVPMSLPLQRADKAFQAFMISIGSVFVLIILILNFLLSVIVINPIGKLARNAEEVSLGKLDTPEIRAKGKDEVGTLIESVNRLRRSLVNAMKMIDD